MSFKGKKNVYLCGSCGHGFITIDTDDGTTPFTAECKNCGSHAYSCMYKIPQDFLARFEPADEWVIASKDQAIKLAPGAMEHAQNGGLFMKSKLEAGLYYDKEE